MNKHFVKDNLFFQISMNAPVAVLNVMTMLHVTILKVVICASVTLDSLEMDITALVSYNLY